MTTQGWTPAEDALAQLLTEQGKDSAEIAATFAARGIPGVWFSRNTHLPGHWYHHSEYNNLDAVSCEEIAWTSETACVMLEELAGSSAWPFPRAIASDMREKADGYLRELF